jgi:hypothetical protein
LSYLSFESHDERKSLQSKRLCLLLATSKSYTFFTHVPPNAPLRI